MACQDHVAGVVGEDGIGVSGCVIEKFFRLIVCSVGLDCWVAMVLSDVIIVGSTART